jgi:glycosyltransferase involved in cell wall biosynthesis
VRINNPTGSQEGRIRALCKTVRDVNPTVALSVNIPDLYLAHMRLRHKRLSPTRAVMTLHGIQSDLLGDAHVFRQVLDAVICTNRLTCDLAREVAGVPADCVLYAPYGVQVSAEISRRPRRDIREPIRIAWVGRLEQEQKRVGDIIPILAALDERHVPFELWLVGTGPEEDVLRRQLTPWLKQGRAKMLGELPRDRVCAEIYPQADCLLLTSSWETGPIVIWEAMAAGLPVVTSEYAGSGPEGSLIHGENCLMFPVGDVRLAAACISDIVAPEINIELAAAGLALVRSRYSVQSSVMAWDSALRRVSQTASPNEIQMNIPSPVRGRLDRWLGVGRAERIRQMFGIRFGHSNAGGEWPHTLFGAEWRQELVSGLKTPTDPRLAEILQDT